MLWIILLIIVILAFGLWAAIKVAFWLILIAIAVAAVLYFLGSRRR